MTQHAELQALRNKEDGFQHLIESLEDLAIYTLDAQGYVATWNRSAELKKGYSSQEILGKHVRTFFVAEDAAAAIPERELAQAARTGRCAGEGWRVRKDGKRFWMSYVITSIRDESGKLIGFSKITRDLSERKRHEDQLIKKEREVTKASQFAESIFSSSPFATIVTDIEGDILSINPAAERMFLYKGEDLLKLPSPLLLLDKQELARRAQELSAQYGFEVPAGFETLTVNPRRGLVEESEWQLVRCDGSRFAAQLTVSALTMPAGETTGYVLIAYDITERKRTQEYVEHVAQHDALTGLPGRNLLHDRLEMAIARAERWDKKVALLMVDLDHFKHVNDMSGHLCGDDVLKVVAERLKHSVRACDTVARMGGDEFIVLLEDATSADFVQAICGKIEAELARPFSDGSQLTCPTASIGICVYPDHATTSEMMLRNSDLAMYQVKEKGRNGHRVFDSQLEKVAVRRRLMESNLGQALALNELELVYQPQISMQTGMVTGVEALLRWQSGTLGAVMPNDFIPVAEESGLIVPIGEWVIRQACAQGKKMQEELGRPITIAVNVSPRQFHQSSLVDVIQDSLKTSGLDAASLELEVTENILVDDSPRPMAVLEKLRALGVRMAIDDFGTGFSSMSYILRFLVDRLKIDQSFVREMTTSANNSAVISAMIAMAQSLGITVIAEGVETASHRELLHAQGCDEAQGYLYSRPVSYEKLLGAVREIEEMPRVADLKVRLVERPAFAA